MKIASFLAALILCAAAGGIHAQVVTPNPAPTIIKTAPYTITKPGYYQLGADLTVTRTCSQYICRPGEPCRA